MLPSLAESVALFTSACTSTSMLLKASDSPTATEVAPPAPAYEPEIAAAPVMASMLASLSARTEICLADS